LSPSSHASDSGLIFAFLCPPPPSPPLPPTHPSPVSFHLGATTPRTCSHSSCVRAGTRASRRRLQQIARARTQQCAVPTSLRQHRARQRPTASAALFECVHRVRSRRLRRPQRPTGYAPRSSCAFRASASRHQPQRRPPIARALPALRACLCPSTKRGRAT
jgi:hypothetical protein